MFTAKVPEKYFQVLPNAFPSKYTFSITFLFHYIQFIPLSGHCCRNCLISPLFLSCLCCHLTGPRHSHEGKRCQPMATEAIRNGVGGWLVPIWTSEEEPKIEMS